jgi:hypothetical protein
LPRLTRSKAAISSQRAAASLLGRITPSAMEYPTGVVFWAASVASEALSRSFESEYTWSQPPLMIRASAPSDSSMTSSTSSIMPTSSADSLRVSQAMNGVWWRALIAGNRLADRRTSPIASSLMKRMRSWYSET